MPAETEISEYDYAPAGWSTGYTDSGEWLTIPGSAYHRTPLFPTKAEAEQHAVDRTWHRMTDWNDHVLRWVTRTGSYFRISEPQPAPMPPADRVAVTWGEGCRYCQRYRQPCGRHESQCRSWGTDH
jgi:hypothetical protein